MAIAAIKRTTFPVNGFSKISAELVPSLILCTAPVYNQTRRAACRSDDHSGVTVMSFLPSVYDGQELHCYNERVSRCRAIEHPREIEFLSSLVIPRVMNSLHVLPFACPSCRHFSSADSARLLSQDREPASALADELENALGAHMVEESWTAFERLKKLRGFPRRYILNRLIIALTYSGETKWLKKAYALVLTVLKERKWELLGCDSLTLLCLGLARAQLPVPASTVLRIMVEKHEFPPASMWSTAVAHMVKTESGAYLASEVVIEICGFYKDRRERNKRLLAMKPGTVVFNIVLNACLVFGSTRKAEEILELMLQIGVKADATSFALMAQIYERNGHREELKKLKRRIGEDPNMLGYQYQQFYASMLTSHLNFDDLDAASELVLDMLQRAKVKQISLNAGKSVLEGIKRDANTDAREVHGAGQIVKDESPKQSVSQITCEKIPKPCRLLVESEKLCMDSIIQIEPQNSQNNFLFEFHRQQPLVSCENGILRPNERIYAKLAKGYLEAGRADELAQFLIRVQQEEGRLLAENSACAQVIDACVALGWLDYAHDMLDEMNAAAAPIGIGLYSSLLKAYCRTKRPMEAAALLKEVRKLGLQLDASCYEAAVEACVSENDLYSAQDLFTEMRETNLSLKDSKPNLMALLLEEVKEDQQVIPGVYNMNSVIHFFCKGHLMIDAEKAFKKMKSSGHQPNAQTFEYLINGYSAEGNYRQITVLWGEMKRMAQASAQSGVNPIRLDRELHDTLLSNFIRGGYFERALEVISRMEQCDMFIDKWKYKQEFLKLYKRLYKNTELSQAKTEVQSKRIEQVLAFKKWAGLD